MKALKLNVTELKQFLIENVGNKHTFAEIVTYTDLKLLAKCRDTKAPNPYYNKVKKLTTLNVSLNAIYQNKVIKATENPDFVAGANVNGSHIADSRMIIENELKGDKLQYHLIPNQKAKRILIDTEKNIEISDKDICGNVFPLPNDNKIVDILNVNFSNLQKIKVNGFEIEILH